MSVLRTRSFLEKLQASHLLDQAQLAEVAGWPSAANPDPRVLARELVAKKLLTKFQAEQILAGHANFLVGPYILVDRIGGGGMGKVYKAVHQRMQRTVALKVLHRAKRADADAQARFLREIRASARLNHPNIVTAFDVGEEGDVTYLVLEYVQGDNLQALIQKQGKLPYAQAAEIACQVALALEHAREHSVVHRDIKPSNVLVTRDGTAKVLDMGLARFANTGEGDETGGLTQDGVVMGTLNYLSPEQAIDSHRVDTRADIYSLGCTLYHMLTGQVPFPGGTAARKLMKHQMQQPTPIAQLTPDVPGDLVRVVAGMMAKRKEDRYQTPVEVAGALVPWVNPSLVAAVPDVPLSVRIEEPPEEPVPVVPVAVTDPTPAPEGLSLGPPPPPPPPLPEPVLAFDQVWSDAMAEYRAQGHSRRRAVWRAESMLVNWQALRRALDRSPIDDREVDGLINAMLTDYRDMPQIMDVPGTPGYAVMAQIEHATEWGVPGSALRTEKADLERGAQYLADFIAFFEAHAGGGGGGLLGALRGPWDQLWGWVFGHRPGRVIGWLILIALLALGIYLFSCLCTSSYQTHSQRWR